MIVVTVNFKVKNQSYSIIFIWVVSVISLRCTHRLALWSWL